LTIVEFGLGHGNITEEILRSISDHSTLYSFEVNKDFYEYVHEKLADQRLTIINIAAETFRQHVPEKVDYVISSIPFSFMSRKKIEALLSDVYSCLKDEGYFSQVLYSKRYIKNFRSVFEESKLVRPNRFSLEHIFHCEKIGHTK